MKTITTFVKKNWKKILIIIVLLFFVQKIFVHFGKEDAPVQSVSAASVKTFSIGQHKDSFVDSFCSVETVGDASVIAEVSGKVTSVSVSEGDNVEKGDTLLTLDNIQQRVAVQNAKVALKSAELALFELENDSDESVQGSVLSQTKAQQDIIIRDAYSTYLNTGLSAYPEKTNQSGDAPAISGNYACVTEGEYILDIYSSSANSGASIRLSGLESGTMTLSTDYPVALGSCGLEIVFPDDFKKNTTWTIPVPNTRGASYLNVKNNYENALSGKDLMLNNITASPEKIAQEKARVTQAQLQLESAYDALSKTIIKAPISGVLSTFDVDKGDFISNMQNVARIQSLGVTELVTYVTGDEMAYIKTGNIVSVEGASLAVLDVAPSIDTITKKIKVTIENTSDIKLDPGVQYNCSIQRIFPDEVDSGEQGVTIPLSAISVIGIDTYVFTVDKEGKALQIRVETGALLGDMIVVYGNIDGDLVADARGIRNGQIINIKE